MTHNRFVVPILILLPTLCHSEIVFDGSLGRSGPIYPATLEDSGRSFQLHRIEAEQGRRAGNNLFHNFHAFNLASSPDEAERNPGMVARSDARMFSLPEPGALRSAQRTFTVPAWCRIKNAPAALESEIFLFFWPPFRRGN